MENTTTEKLAQAAAALEGAFYFYDAAYIAVQAKKLLQHFEGFEFLYSVKTNPFAPVVKQILTAGIGADAASPGEVGEALAAGASPEYIFYSAPGKTRRDILSAMGHCTIIADSYAELALLNELAKSQNIILEVGLRINPNFAMGQGKGTSSKFGVDEESLASQIGFIKGLSNIKAVGIHVHVRSQVLNEEVLYHYYANVLTLAHYWAEQAGFALHFINFGGGLGIPYTPGDAPLDIPLLSQKCRALLAAHKKALPGTRFIIETGRFLVGQAGFYVSPVVDVKHSRGVTYAIVENGLNGFLRPAVAALLQNAAGEGLGSFTAEPLYTAAEAFSVSLLGKENLPPTGRVNIVGNLCTATDIVENGVLLPPVEIGDRIVVTNAGSYAYTLSPLLFSGHTPPTQVFLDEAGTLQYAT